MQPAGKLFLSVALALCLALIDAVGSQSRAADPESNGDPAATKRLPIEKRVCRLYFDPIRPTAGGQPRKPFYGMTPEELVDVVANLGTDMWAATCVTGNGVFYESELVPQDKSVPGDALARLVKRAHERGILVQGCQQLSELEVQDRAGRMKDWMLVPLDDGRSLKPSPRWLSFAAPGFRDWMGEYMAEHLRVAKLDGLWGTSRIGSAAGSGSRPPRSRSPTTPKPTRCCGASTARDLKFRNRFETGTGALPAISSLS